MQQEMIQIWKLATTFQGRLKGEKTLSGNQELRRRGVLGWLSTKKFLKRERRKA
jgi:hypothetical protein